MNVPQAVLWCVRWCFAALTVLVLGACAAPRDASRTISRERIESGQIVPADELRVAEYLGYYAQRFPEPVNTTLGLDLRLGQPWLPSAGGQVWLQIGAQARSAEPADVAPLNLAIVVDCSGSMADDDKMPYVKAALREFLAGLATNDRVALVTYSDAAQVLTRSREVGDGDWIAAAVERLVPDGSTNLHDGLVTGLAEVDREYDVRRNNLVVLLTDGIANAGVTDPGDIADAAAEHADRGIHVVTIGLGGEFNDALLAEVARRGQGAYHYIDRPAEIGRVFREGFVGMVQKAASHVSVVLRPASGVRIEGLTGYDGRPPRGDVQVDLQDMGSGDSQVVLAELDVSRGDEGARDLVVVELRYHDEASGRDESETGPVGVEMGGAGDSDPLWDTEVLRNVTIQRSAEGLQEIDGLYRSGRYQEAWELAGRLERDLREVADLTGEGQMLEDAELMREYQDTLADWVWEQTGSAPERDEGDGEARDWRGRSPSSTPAARRIEIR